MSGLLYREDFDEVRDRLTAWWNGEDIGRPSLQLFCRREDLIEELPDVATPDGWITDYSVSNFGYREFLGWQNVARQICLGDAVPFACPDLAPNCLALYLGCEGEDQSGTVWCKPFLDEPSEPGFKFDPDNDYWKFTLKLGEKFKEIGEGKFLQQFPDLIEGLDTLAAMRGTEELLFDLIERPDWVHKCMEQITPLYFEYYDKLYDLMKDERGGSVFWSWAPGRMCKMQCDFSAMIGPDMFGEFMLPVLKEMTSRFDYCMYHWDGPGAIPHHDHLLSLDDLNMIQWTPGAGASLLSDKEWWPLYHKTFEAGKKVALLQIEDREEVAILKKEFGPNFKNFLLRLYPGSITDAEEVIALAND